MTFGSPQGWYICSFPSRVRGADGLRGTRPMAVSRTWGAPKNPRTSVPGTNPGNRYASRNCRLGFRTHSLKQVFNLRKSAKTRVDQASNPLPRCKIPHSPRRRPFLLNFNGAALFRARRWLIPRVLMAPSHQCFNSGGIASGLGYPTSGVIF